MAKINLKQLRFFCYLYFSQNCTHFPRWSKTRLLSRTILKEFRVWIKGPAGFLWWNNKGLKISCLCTFKMTYKERKHVIFIEKSPEERFLDGKGHLLAKGPWSESSLTDFLVVFYSSDMLSFLVRFFSILFWAVLKDIGKERWWWRHVLAFRSW